jgi:DnaJ family protein C protein 9
MSGILEQAYGTLDVDLYADVLKVSKEATPAQLRKAYYQRALEYHPDKNPSPRAQIQFQAISWTFQLLKDPEKRADYDESGALPSEDYDDDSDGDEASKPTMWKDYFDLIFGKLKKSDIDQFAMKYKMSDEEERDVLENYNKYKGNFGKMLEFVMLSEERDVQRWKEDYIQPAIIAGKISNYEDAMKKSMKTIKKKLDKKQAAEQESDQEEEEEDETETEESEEEEKTAKAKKESTKKEAPKKAKPTAAKATKKRKGGGAKNSSEQDLIMAIRNKNRGGHNPFAALGARYGVEVDDDPLDDAAFAKIQSKLKKKKK